MALRPATSARRKEGSMPKDAPDKAAIWLHSEPAYGGFALGITWSATTWGYIGVKYPNGPKVYFRAGGPGTVDLWTLDTGVWDVAFLEPDDTGAPGAALASMAIKTELVDVYKETDPETPSPTKI